MRALLFVVAVGCAGCERGCLSLWLGEHGVGSTGHETRERDPRDPPAGSLAGELSGTDCSGGLLRCVGGRVEASLDAHLPHPCGTSTGRERPGTCACPWEPLAPCASGCVVEGLEIAATPDAGAEQLCRPLVPSTRPLLPGDPVAAEICAGEGFSCKDGIVRSCDGPALPVRPVATCSAGCQPGIFVDHGDAMDLDGVASILCRRDHAERR